MPAHHDDPAGRSETVLNEPNGEPDGPTTAELLRLGNRAMLHERLDDARSYLMRAAAPALGAHVDSDAAENATAGTGSQAMDLAAMDLAAIDPAAIDALAYLGSVEVALREIEVGQRHVEESLALGPARFAPNQKAGELAVRLGDYGRAADLFLAALRASEPGTHSAKAAELSLRSARRRAAAGIRHEAVLPAWPARALRRLRARWAIARVAPVVPGGSQVPGKTPTAS